METKVKRGGRRKFQLNKDTLSPERLAGFVQLSRETLAEGRLLIPLEVAAYALTYDLATMRRLVRQGIIPAVDAPEPYGKGYRSNVRVSAEAVIAWVRSQHPQHI